MSKFLKIGVLNRFPSFGDEKYEIMDRIDECDILNICEKYKNITDDELHESTAKILVWLMEHEAKYITVDLNIFDNEYGHKKMTMKELEYELNNKGIDLTKLIEDQLGYKIKIIEEAGKHEANTDND